MTGTIIKNITFDELQNWKKDKINYQLIDVRETAEHQLFNIGGKLIPLDELIKRSNEIEIAKPVIFYCKRGIRSQIAIQKLSRKGVSGDFYNLIGGILPFKNIKSST